MAQDWDLDYTYEGLPVISDWKFEIMGFEPCLKLEGFDESERKSNPNESIKLELEMISCEGCGKTTNQILLNEYSNYPIDKTISKIQVFRCGCEKINERIIYGCDKCKKCTVQVFVQNIRNKKPETVEESKFLLKIFCCKTCKTFNEILPDILDDNDGWVDVK